MGRSLRNAEYKTFKTYDVARHYADKTFEALYKIFCAYRNRGGILPFTEFAYIPIKKNPGKNLDLEPGFWTKGIRNNLATQGILDYNLK